MRFQAGQKAGDYEFLDVVESTATGVSYRVRNTLADRLELLKVLSQDLQDDPERVERFLREAKIHSRLHHPNIAAFYNATHVEGQLVMTTELVEGESLAQRIAGGSLSTEQATKYFEQALSALSYAHQEGVVHRDITPKHLIITQADAVKVTGFGLAKKPADPQLTQPGIVMGSMHYMSPEQVKGSNELDRRSDIYSLGVVLYEAVTGRKPFDSKSQFEIFLAHVNEDPAPPSSVRAGVPPEIDQIVLTAMAKQPASRFQTAEEFRSSLSKLQAVVGTPPARPAAEAQPAPAAAEQQHFEPAAGPSEAAAPAPVEGSSTWAAEPAPAAADSAAPSAEAAAPFAAQAAPAREESAAAAPPPVAPIAEPMAGHEKAESPGPQGANTEWKGAAEPPPAQPSTPAAEQPWPAGAQESWPAANAAEEAWPQTAAEQPWPQGAAEEPWHGNDDAGTARQVPILLRPNGDSDLPPQSPAADVPERQRVDPAQSWFGDQAFAGWTSKDVLAIGVLTFVIVAAVFFAMLTFLNR